MTEKRQHCAYCGDDMGVWSRVYSRPNDTCGKPECERWSRDAEAAERAEAHEQLDRDMGWS